MTEQIARYKPGDNVPVFAEAAILAGRFISITGNKTTHGDYPAQHAAAGAFPFGVAEQDSAAASEPAHSQERRVNATRRGSIARVTAGVEVEAGEEGMVGTGGKVVPLGNAEEGQATLVTGLVASNNAIAWTANDPGAEGNAITVTLVDPGSDGALSVDVDGESIVVTLAYGSGAVTSTAALVIAAINEHDTASQLVDVANSGASNGSGLVAAVAATPLAGGTDGGTGRAVCRILTDGDADEIVECDLY